MHNDPLTQGIFAPLASALCYYRRPFPHPRAASPAVAPPFPDPRACARAPHQSIVVSTVYTTLGIDAVAAAVAEGERREARRPRPRPRAPLAHHPPSARSDLPGSPPAKRRRLAFETARRAGVPTGRRYSAPVSRAASGRVRRTWAAMARAKVRRGAKQP